MNLYIEISNGSKLFLEDVTLCEAKEKKEDVPAFIAEKIEDNQSTNDN